MRGGIAPPLRIPDASPRLRRARWRARARLRCEPSPKAPNPPLASERRRRSAMRRVWDGRPIKFADEPARFATSQFQNPGI
jgi:hypothetical protein